MSALADLQVARAREQRADECVTRALLSGRESGGGAATAPPPSRRRQRWTASSTRAATLSAARAAGAKPQPAAQPAGVDALAQLTFREKLIAGSIARGAAQTVLHPIDVARTRLQAKGLARNWAPSVFLKGLVPQIVLAIPAGGIQFVAYEWCKARFAALLLPRDKADAGNAAAANAKPVRQLVVDLLAGAGGALAASVVRVPQEVLKQRIQADMYPNIGVALPSVLRASGVRGLFNGYFATVSRDVPWNALSFLFFAQESRAFERVTGRKPDRRENLLLGALGGAVAAAIMTPMDVIKTRLMTQRDGAYRGILDTCARVVREEGAHTLMRGAVPRVMFLAPLAAITLTMYNAIGSVMLERRRQAAAAGRRTAMMTPMMTLPSPQYRAL